MNFVQVMVVLAVTNVVLVSSPMANELTLESFDISEGTPATTEKPKTAIEACLLNTENCASEELQSGANFSIDDVVNLGIIDRSQVAQTKTSETGETQNVSTTAALPSIDMEILFDYNSASIRADQAVRLVELSMVLGTPKFEDYTFAFVGHTDNVGSDDYNRALSQKRALEVAKFVSQAAGIPQSQTTATGLGFAHLKTPFDPAGAQNRRVQLVLIPR